MSEVALATYSGDWMRAAADNFTDTSFGTLQETLTEPTVATAGVHNFGTNGTSKNGLLVSFYGTSANNQNFNARIWGLNRVNLGSGVNPQFSYRPILLAQFAVTLGNLAGTANCAIGASDFEADTIALTYGNDDVAISIQSPANDVRGAYAMLDCVGSRWIRFQFDRNSSAASCNALWRKI